MHGGFAEEIVQDKGLSERVKAVGIEDGESTAAFYARAAKGFGYDFAADELEEAMRAQQEAATSFLDGVELSDDELDQVAGGWCTFSEECSNLIAFRKHHSNCFATYDSNENCAYTDYCNGPWLDYD